MTIITRAEEFVCGCLKRLGKRWGNDIWFCNRCME